MEMKYFIKNIQFFKINQTDKKGQTKNITHKTRKYW